MTPTVYPDPADAALYREMVSVLLTQAHALLAEQRALTRRYEALLADLRALRDAS